MVQNQYDFELRLNGQQVPPQPIPAQIPKKQKKKPDKNNARQNLDAIRDSFIYIYSKGNEGTSWGFVDLLEIS